MSCPDKIVAFSTALLGALETARRFGPTVMPVLIIGDTGTGKELFARYIHDLSGRKGPLVDVDCGSIPEELFESALFGHRKGAFTGAVERTDGLLARADGGTLFLDEMGSLSAGAQAKLLRVLETREVRRVGGERTRRVDFRLIGTVQTGIGPMVQSGAFRLDLIQRVAGAVIRLPCLEDRPEDVVPLARHFARSFGATLSPEAERLLENHPWPGNVRELRWTVHRSALLQGGHVVTGTIMREALESGPAELLAEHSHDQSEAAAIRTACRVYEGDADKAAAALRMGRSTFYRKARELGIDLRSFRSRGTGTS